MYIKHNIYFCNKAHLFVQGWVMFFLIDTGTTTPPKLFSPKQILVPEGTHTYPSNYCTLLFLIWCSHLQTLHHSPVSLPSAQHSHSASYHFLPQNIFICYSPDSLGSPLSWPIAVMHAIPPWGCAIPNSASNLHIRIDVAGSAERRVSAPAIHLLQADGEG